MSLGERKKVPDGSSKRSSSFALLVRLGLMGGLLYVTLLRGEHRRAAGSASVRPGRGRSLGGDGGGGGGRGGNDAPLLGTSQLAWDDAEGVAANY